MKALVLGLAAVVVLATLPVEATEASRRHHGSRGHVSIGFGHGYGYGRSYGYRSGYGYGRSYGYFGSYGYYPRSYIGFNVWPRYRGRRVRSERRSEVSAKELYVYPAAGQSEAQLADDRYACHVWSADATDYDPTVGTGMRDEAEAYGRAFTACMEGRNYVVK